MCRAHFLHSRVEYIDPRSTRFFVEAPVAENEQQQLQITLKPTEAQSISASIPEWRRCITLSALLRTAAQTGNEIKRSWWSHGLMNYTPTQLNSAGREEAITEDQIHHPAETFTQRQRDICTMTQPPALGRADIMRNMSRSRRFTDPFLRSLTTLFHLITVFMSSVDLSS